MKHKKWEQQDFPWNSTVNLNSPFRSPLIHKIFRTKEYKTYQQLDDLTLTIVLLSAYVFMSDRYLSKSESDVLTSRIQSIYPTLDKVSLEKIIMRYAELYNPNPVPGSLQDHYGNAFQPVFGTQSGLQKLLNELKGWVAKRTVKSSIAYLLFEIAHADNVLTRAERVYLIKISRKLGLLDMEISRMFAFFEGRIKEINFHNKHSWNTSASEKKRYSDQFNVKSNHRSDKKAKQKKKSAPPKQRTQYGLDTDFLVLGIKRNASNKAIKKAYRKWVMKYHPDRLINASELEKQTGKKMLATIQKAYDRIKKIRRIK